MRPISLCRARWFASALLLLAFLVAPALLAADEFPAEFVRFRPYERNPVFTAAGPGHWDVKIRERGWILKEGNRWRMWYTGYDGTPEGIRRLGTATSSDGLTWTRDPQNPLVADHWIEDMQVVKYGDTYLMFAEGVGDEAQLLSSRDGRTWKREGKLDVRTADGKPIPAGPYGTPTVWFEEGVWNLFYERGDEAVWLARSSDLKVWTNVRDEPVLSRGPEAFDRVMIAVNQIVKHEGRYYAWYHGTGMADKPRRWTVNLAVSRDLVNWKKYPGNPLTPESEDKSSGIVVHDGQGFRLYTMHEKVDVHLPAK